MLTFSIVRFLVVEKRRESSSGHLLCAAAGREGTRPPLTGKTQGNFFRSLAQGARKCSGMERTDRACCPEEYHLVSLKYVISTAKAVYSFVFLSRSVPLRFRSDLSKEIIRI